MSILSDQKVIENGLAEYRRKLEEIPDELFNQTPPGGGWSYGEVYSHIMQANLACFIAVEKCINGTGKTVHKKLGIIPRLILFIGQLPKVKAPKEVASMTVNISKEEARNLIIKVSNKLNQNAPLVKTAADYSKTKHPRLGMFNAVNWLRFINMHTMHHLKQLKRINKKFSTE